MAWTNDQKAKLKVIAEEACRQAAGDRGPGPRLAAPLPPGSAYRDRWDLAYARCRQTVEALSGLKIDPARLRLGVVQTRGPASLGETADPREDCQVNIYLTDLLPEKYTSASAATLRYLGTVPIFRENLGDCPNFRSTKMGLSPLPGETLTLFLPEFRGHCPGFCPLIRERGRG